MATWKFTYVRPIQSLIVQSSRRSRARKYTILSSTLSPPTCNISSKGFVPNYSRKVGTSSSVFPDFAAADERLQVPLSVHHFRYGDVRFGGFQVQLCQYDGVSCRRCQRLIGARSASRHGKISSQPQCRSKTQLHLPTGNFSDLIGWTKFVN